MATPIEKPFLGQEGTERLVAVIKDLLSDKLGADDLEAYATTAYVDEKLSGIETLLDSI